MLTRENYIDRASIKEALTQIIDEYFSNQHIENKSNLTIQIHIISNTSIFPYYKAFTHKVGIDG